MGRGDSSRLVGERARFSIEVAALTAAEQLHIAAPRIVVSDDTGEATSRLAILSTYLEGRSRVPLTPNPERRRALGRAAATLARAPVAAPGLPVRHRSLADVDFITEPIGVAPTSALALADKFVAENPLPSALPNVLAVQNSHCFPTGPRPFASRVAPISPPPHSRLAAISLYGKCCKQSIRGNLPLFDSIDTWKL
jgi:hypothetical protein